MTAPARRLTRAELCDRHEAAEILGVHPNTIDHLGRTKDPATGKPFLARYGIRGMTKTVLYSREQVADCIVEMPIEHDEDVA